LAFVLAAVTQRTARVVRTASAVERVFDDHRRAERNAAG
jgi:hypothetical protein